MDVFKKHIDEVFDGRYKIKREIGTGGMAIVYEATDLKTGQSVALKMLKESISDNTQALRRFINESKAVAMMDHANIVRILDVSVKTEHKFIVMEYIKGITLRDYMTKKGKLSWQEACAFITQILQALDRI
jgi:serine/threonine-protein kinase